MRIEAGGSLPRSLGFVLEVRSGRTDERSGRLRRVVQNMLLLLPLLLGSPYWSMQDLIRCLSKEIWDLVRSWSKEVGDEMRCTAKRAGYHKGRCSRRLIQLLLNSRRDGFTQGPF